MFPKLLFMELKIMFKKVLIATTLLAAVVNANASSSAFGVAGTITPEACNVTMTGGTINLGSISTSLVKTYSTILGTYQFPTVLAPISITCSAPTKVEISFVDNKAGKRFAMDANDSARYGMVDGAGTTGIGAYNTQFINTTIDTVAVGQYLNAVNNTTTWSASGPVGAPNVAAPGYTVGFAKLAGATTPDSFTMLSGSLQFTFWVSSAYINAATAAVSPSGSGTLTLVYI